LGKGFKPHKTVYWPRH